MNPNQWLERTAGAVTRRLQGEAAGGAPPCAAAQPRRSVEVNTPLGKAEALAGGVRSAGWVRWG
jgi:hypothetical protein